MVTRQKQTAKVLACDSLKSKYLNAIDLRKGNKLAFNFSKGMLEHCAF